MPFYLVYSPVHTYGTYEGATERDAIEACVRDAGYRSIEDFECQLEMPCLLEATEQGEA